MSLLNHIHIISSVTYGQGYSSFYVLLDKVYNLSLLGRGRSEDYHSPAVFEYLKQVICQLLVCKDVRYLIPCYEKSKVTFFSWKISN